MKTEISAEWDVVNQAGRAAREMGVSPDPGRPLSPAPQPSLRTQQQERMTEQLNRIYAVDTDPSEARTVNAMKTAFRSVLRERW
jgi:hypothetical protein